MAFSSSGSMDTAGPLDDPNILKGIIEDGPDAVALLDLTGVFLAVNRAAEEMLGRSRESLVGRSFEEARFLAESELPRARIALAKAGRGEPVGPETFRVQDSGGERRDTQIRTRTVDLSGKPLIILTARDITEQRVSERRALLLSTAIAQSAEAVIITTAEGVIEYVNPAFETISGYTAGEAMGKRPSLLKSGRHAPGFYARLWETILSGRVWKGRLVNRRKDGSLYEEESTISPVRSDTGRIDHFVAVKRDVSKVMELERQLRQSQKMEAMGVLAGGIAHDFNNILTPILGYAQLLQKTLREDGRDRERLNHILNASLRAKDLVQQILTFSRKSEGQRIPVELEPLIKESLKFMRHSIPVNIRIRCRMEAEGGSVLADPTQVHQVLINLLTNAYQSMMPEGGTIEVRLDRMRVRKDTSRTARGKYLRLTVTDDGSGMSTETAARAFEPFFTTKRKGEGTGLGLSVVHGIVTAHGGHIRIDSEIERGTGMVVLLPEIEPIRPSRPSVPETLSGAGTVLVVDDQESVRDVTRDMLVHTGFHVIAFDNGSDALDFIRTHPGDADLLITDHSMPGLSGSRLALEAEVADPRLPIVVMTGNKTESAALDGKERARPVLEKPFDVEALSRIVLRHIRKRVGKEAA